MIGRPAITRPQDLFPPAWFSVELVDVAAADPAALHPLEARQLQSASPGRRAEFAAGRQAARRALERLGVVGAALPADRHRCPQWPPGTQGSISHSGGRAMGVATRDRQVQALGVDLQGIAAASATAIEHGVCDAAERRWLAALRPEARALHTLALFSAKEAVYKCTYSATGERLGFADASLRVDLASGLFSARLHRARGRPPRDTLVGRVGCDGRHVFSGLYWLRPGPATPTEDRP